MMRSTRSFRWIRRASSFEAAVKILVIFPVKKAWPLLQHGVDFLSNEYFFHFPPVVIRQKAPRSYN